MQTERPVNSKRLSHEMQTFTALTLGFLAKNLNTVAQKQPAMLWRERSKGPGVRQQKSGAGRLHGLGSVIKHTLFKQHFARFNRRKVSVGAHIFSFLAMEAQLCSRTASMVGLFLRPFHRERCGNVSVRSFKWSYRWVRVPL